MVYMSTIETDKKSANSSSPSDLKESQGKSNGLMSLNGLKLSLYSAHTDIFKDAHIQKLPHKLTHKV